MYSIIIWCLGFAVLGSTCSAGHGHVRNATGPAVLQVQETSALGVRPTDHVMTRHERRKKEKEEHKVKGAPKVLDIAAATNKTDTVKTSDVLVTVPSPIGTIRHNELDVSCSFANPALEQAKELLGLGLFDTYKAAVEYAELTNVPYRAALGKWFSKNITMEGLYDEGIAMGHIHRVWFNSTIPTDNRTEVICKLESSLYSQMKKTCHFREWAKDLITVAVALMEGFAQAVGHTSFAGCKK